MAHQHETNVPSKLLSDDENNALFKTLPARIYTQATTVVELKTAARTSLEKWTEHGTGILCFIKDCNLRAFFIKIYSKEDNHILFEQRVMESLQYQVTDQSHYHTFTADECHVGLSFADDGEANHFANIVKTKIEKRTKRLVRKATAKSRSTAAPRSPPKPVSKPESVPTPPPPKSPAKAERRPKSELQLSKGDRKSLRQSLYDKISEPFGFQHVVHVGTASSSATGEPDDPRFFALLKGIGISKKALNDPAIRDGIQELIEEFGGLDAIMGDARKAGITFPSATVSPPTPLKPIALSPTSPTSKPRPTSPAPPIPVIRPGPPSKASKHAPPAPSTPASPPVEIKTPLPASILADIRKFNPNALHKVKSEQDAHPSPSEGQHQRQPSPMSPGSVSPGSPMEPWGILFAVRNYLGTIRPALRSSITCSDDSDSDFD